jgi:hypothetical protein
VRDPLAEQVQVALVEGVDVRPGEVTRDPRLAPLDVRGKLAVPADDPGRQRVAVLGPDGRVAPRGRAWLSDRPDDGIWWTAGRVAIPANARGELAVWAEGSRLTRFPLPLPEPRVHLEPALAVRVVTTVPQAVRGARLQVLLMLHPESGDGVRGQLAQEVRPVELDARGEALAELPFPGAWTARVVVLRTPAGGPPQRAELSDGASWPVLVADRAGEQRVAIAPDPAHWARCLRDLGLPVEDH